MSIFSLLSKIFSPKPVVARSEKEQAEVDKQTLSLRLYDMASCPFCIKVRREMTRLNLNIKVLNAQQAEHREVLLAQGGKTQVPCLRIEEGNKTRWLYESSAINAYLNKHFR